MLSNRAIAVRSLSRHLHRATASSAFRYKLQVAAVDKVANQSPSQHSSAVQTQLRQPNSNFFSSQAGLQSKDDYVEITITGASGTQTQSILRSYPKGKAEKLIAGLERLLSTTNPHPETNEHKFRNHQWKLASSGDAIHLAFTLSSDGRIEDIIQAIKKEADGLDHHPHIAYRHDESDGRVVVVVTCATHVPKGLSLKDVKLAERVEATLDGVEAGKQGSVGQVEDRDKEAAESLVKENEDAAERARTDPNSTCAKGGRGD